MRPRLLFLYLLPHTFVRDDLELLQAHYDVRTFHFDARRAKTMTGLLRLLWAQARWLRRELREAHVVFGWFADYHMALPIALARRAGVPAAVALGGFEANTVPGLGYGVMLSRWRAPLARFVMRHANLLLPVAEALIWNENRFAAWPAVLQNGVRAHVPGLTTPCTVVPTGYDVEAWPVGPGDRPPSVLSVGLCADERTFRLKGLDLLLAAAARMPGVPFRVVGVATSFAGQLRARGSIPDNVTLDPPMPREALADAYCAASVYAQLSRSEGMPNVLCEAMLCGAIPVGSAVGGIPEIVGDAGLIVASPVPDEIDQALQSALAAPAPARRASRARIASAYTTEHRRRRLLDALDRLTHG